MLYKKQTTCVRVCVYFNEDKANALNWFGIVTKKKQVSHGYRKLVRCVVAEQGPTSASAGGGGGVFT